MTNLASNQPGAEQCRNVSPRLNLENFKLEKMESLFLELFEWMEDFDNDELEPDEHMEQLYDAVKEFNYDNGTFFNPATSVTKYLSWKQIKNGYGNEIY